MIRCKVKLISETRNAGYDTVSLNFGAVYSTDPNHENKKYWDATPSLDLKTMVKDEVAKQFKLGSEYYLTFEEAPAS